MKGRVLFGEKPLPVGMVKLARVSSESGYEQAGHSRIQHDGTYQFNNLPNGHYRVTLVLDKAQVIAATKQKFAEIARATSPDNIHGAPGVPAPKGPGMGGGPNMVGPGGMGGPPGRMGRGGPMGEKSMGPPPNTVRPPGLGPPDPKMVVKGEDGTEIRLPPLLHTPPPGTGANLPGQNTKEPEKADDAGNRKKRRTGPSEEMKANILAQIEDSFDNLTDEQQQLVDDVKAKLVNPGDNPQAAIIITVDGADVNFDIVVKP